MVRARIYIICGNCGCDDEFSYKTHERRDCEDDVVGWDVAISCRNCGTIHTLSDKMPEAAPTNQMEKSDV